MKSEKIMGRFKGPIDGEVVDGEYRVQQCLTIRPRGVARLDECQKNYNGYADVICRFNVE